MTIRKLLPLAGLLAGLHLLPASSSAQAPSGTRPVMPSHEPAAAAYTLAARAGEQPRLFSVGVRGLTHLRGALALSNGEFLLVGAAEDLSWAGSAPRTALAVPGGVSLPGSGGTTTPFLLHVSADFETLKGLYTLPSGSIAEITRLRSTEIPGQPTGAIVISGRFAGLTGAADAYWIARLDGNGVERPIRKLDWLHVVKAPGDAATQKKAAQPGDFANRQPWDVRSDGQVVYAEGEPTATTWAALRVLSADGKTGTMPAWGDEDGPVLVLKAGRKNSLRSTTLEDFNHVQTDENGNPGRKGRYPDDYYFTSHDSNKGPGYTGYRVGQNQTQRVSSLAIDRRDNALYFGTSTQTRLPDGLPDFEPAIISLNADGSLRWWARGYQETNENSTPDQYIDHLDIDYKADRLLVAARCHGNNRINLWPGNALTKAPARPGFKPSFTGNSGNIHISWLGSYGLRDGLIYHATFVAEPAEGPVPGAPLPSGTLAGWPDPKAWVTLNSTIVHALACDPHGRPMLVATGRRPYTTSGALIENLKPSEGVSRWSMFGRIYSPDVAELDYSTLFNTSWDKKTGAGPADRFEARSIVPLDDGFLVVGTHLAKEPESPAKGELPEFASPAWASRPVATLPAQGFVALIPSRPNYAAEVRPQVDSGIPTRRR